MTAKEFFYLVAQMRSAQQKYFQDRQQMTLRVCKVLEGQVDLEIERVKQLTKETE